MAELSEKVMQSRTLLWGVTIAVVVVLCAVTAIASRNGRNPLASGTRNQAATDASASGGDNSIPLTTGDRNQSASALLQPQGDASQVPELSRGLAATATGQGAPSSQTQAPGSVQLQGAGAQ